MNLPERIFSLYRLSIMERVAKLIQTKGRCETVSSRVDRLFRSVTTGQRRFVDLCDLFVHFCLSGSLPNAIAVPRP